MNTKIDSNFGPRAQAYFKAADAQSTSLYNANGTVNKANLSGVKGDLPKLPQAPKKQASLPTQDSVAFSSEARGSEKASSLASNFAAAWG